MALKVLLQGPYASPRQRHRFEREIDLVASLQHPNIVTVYDSGVTKDHRHFFAMEYIHGQPLDVYLSDKDLSVDETLRLFQKICSAVNHAHQRGVIHRDIKPGNIRIDAEGEPHVLDFGLAKAGAGGLTPDGAPVTVTGEFMGTLAYASPEQTKGDPTLIDIRTDVYSLGVILYEMLTGKYPYQVVGQMAEVLKNIAEAEPRKPSTIRRQINDEVETIILKALAKEKDRRYQSADTLGRDIEHYLDGEPIDAKRDSGLYVLKKALHRYKAPAAVAAAFIVLGVVFAITVTVMYRNQSQARVAEIVAKNEAEVERDRARLAESEAKQAQLAEAEAKEQAQKERDRAIKAEQAARRLARLASLANITAAGSALSANETASVRRHLEAVPPEFRNWEWGYLHAESDRSLAVLRGHEIDVTSVRFSPDGSRLASASSDKTVRIWDATTHEELAILQGPESFRSVAFSPDGTLLASGSDDKMARLWNPSTGQELQVLRGHQHDVSSVAFSPDGTRLASGSRDKTIRLWDVSTGEELAVMRGHEDEVWNVKFSPDGTRLASASDDKTARLWDVSTGTELVVLRGHEGLVWSVSFSPDGARLASGSVDKTVRLWDVSTGEELAVLRGHQDWIDSVAFSPDGARLASGSGDKTVRVWDASTGEELAVLQGHEDGIYIVVFSPDSTTLASGGIDGTVRLWGASNGEELTVLRGHKGWSSSAAFSLDGARLASGSGDNTIRLWDVSTGEELAVLHGHEAVVLSVTFSPEGTALASASRDETIRLWDAFTGQELAVLKGHTSAARSVAFSPDGTRLASGSFDRTVRLWDTATGEELAILRGHEASIWSVAFSLDGARLASASNDNTIRLWDRSTGEELAVLREHESNVYSVVFSPDGTRLASGSDDKTVRLWDAFTGEELAVLQGHKGYVWGLTFSPDGKRLASASGDKTVRVWDSQTGEELTVLRGHESYVHSVRFSPDGKRLASSSHDKTVRVWDSQTGVELAVMRGHESYVHSVRFSPDGTRLASSSWDNTIRLWDSLPYRVRFSERQEILAARPEAERIVDELWQKLNDWTSVAQQLRGDIRLSQEVRRAALNEVLRHAVAVERLVQSEQAAERPDAVRLLAARPEAKRIVDGLRRELKDWKSVAKRLREDDSLSETVRRAALNLLLITLNLQREAVREEARELIYDLWHQLQDWRLVANHVREDTTLSEPLRLAGVNEAAIRAVTAEQLAERKQATERSGVDADTLNAFAWLLLICEPADLRDPAAALPVAVKANEMTNYQNASYLDTLALAYHLTGDTAKAIEIQKKAVALLTEDESLLRNELEARLTEFEAALEEEPIPPE